MAEARLGVLVVDDSFVVRGGLRASLELDPSIEVVGEAASGSEGVREAGRRRPDVVLMDHDMPDMSGVAATRALLRAWPEARVLMLSWSERGEDLVAAVLAGVRGYLVHGRYSGEELLAAVHTVGAGGACISPVVTAHLLEAVRRGQVEAGDGRVAELLTARECQVLDLIRARQTNREIAARLGLSEKTVKNHINNLYSKLEVRDRQAAARHPLRLE